MESIAREAVQVEDGEILEPASELKQSCGFDRHADIYPEWVRRVLVDELKYEGPSKVQEMVCQELRRQGDHRQNLIVQSKNGTGKTLAYTTVLIRNLAKEELAEENRVEEVPLAIKALVLAPTREIAIQS